MSYDRPASNHRQERNELDPRFQKIGISAVVAALRYTSEQRNLRYAPVKSTDDTRAAEAVT